MGKPPALPKRTGVTTPARIPAIDARAPPALPSRGQLASFRRLDLNSQTPIWRGSAQAFRQRPCIDRPDRREQILANLEFFDPLNLVDSITCPTAVGLALHDDYHPYNTSMPVFERIPPMKSLHVYADIQTMDKSDFAVHTKAWFDRYLR